MSKSKNEGLFTTIRVLKKSVEKLQDINSKEVEEQREAISTWKTFDKIISEKHSKTIK